MFARLLFLAAATFCFLCSTLYHTFSDHGSAYLLHCVDHLGIQIFIWATACSFVTLAFEMGSRRQLAYLVLTSACLAAVASRLYTMSYHDSGSERSRTALHIMFGAVSTLPVLDYWHNEDRDRDILRAFFKLVMLNSTGGCIYATRFLDSFGMRLNLPGFSHAVMHVLAVYGARIYGAALAHKDGA